MIHQHASTIVLLEPISSRAIRGVERNPAQMGVPFPEREEELFREFLVVKALAAELVIFQEEK